MCSRLRWRRRVILKTVRGFNEGCCKRSGDTDVGVPCSRFARTTTFDDERGVKLGRNLIASRWMRWSRSWRVSRRLNWRLLNSIEKIIVL
jgi:hypothetical protein